MAMQANSGRKRLWWAMGLVALLGLGASQFTIQGQDAVRDDAVFVQLERQANAFFEAVLKGESDAAYDALLVNSQIAARTEVVRDLKDKTKEMESRYGRARGFERLEARRLGQDVILVRYLYKCENYPVLWHFTFYRTAGASDVSTSRENWRLISLKFDTQFDTFAR